MGVGSAGCLMHAVLHGECVMMWVAATWQMWSVFYVEAVGCMNSVGMLECESRCGVCC